MCCCCAAEWHSQRLHHPHEAREAAGGEDVRHGRVLAVDAVASPRLRQVIQSVAIGTEDGGVGEARDENGERQSLVEAAELGRINGIYGHELNPLVYIHMNKQCDIVSTYPFISICFGHTVEYTFIFRLCL